MQTVRAKFQISNIKDYGNTIGIEMNAVYSSDPKSENKAFSDATPSGFMSMNIQKDKAAARVFEQGDVVYIDITVAEKNPWRYLNESLPYPDGAAVELVDDWENIQQRATGVVRVNKKSDERSTYMDVVAADGSILDHSYPREKDVPYRYWRYNNNPTA